MKSISGRLLNWLGATGPQSEIQSRRQLDKSSSPAAGESSHPSKMVVVHEEPRTSPKAEGSNDALDALSASIRNLHGIARDMNSELAIQSKMIDGIDCDMPELEARLHAQSRDVQRLT